MLEFGVLTLNCVHVCFLDLNPLYHPCIPQRFSLFKFPLPRRCWFSFWKVFSLATSYFIILLHLSITNGRPFLFIYQHPTSNTFSAPAVCTLPLPSLFLEDSALPSSWVSRSCQVFDPQLTWHSAFLLSLLPLKKVFLLLIVFGHWVRDPQNLYKYFSALRSWHF